MLGAISSLIDMLALNAGTAVLGIAVLITLMSYSVTNSRVRRMLKVIGSKLELNTDETLYILFGDDDGLGPIDFLEKIL